MLAIKLKVCSLSPRNAEPNYKIIMGTGAGKSLGRAEGEGGAVGGVGHQRQTHLQKRWEMQGRRGEG